MEAVIPSSSDADYYQEKAEVVAMIIEDLAPTSAKPVIERGMEVLCLGKFEVVNVLAFAELQGMVSYDKDDRLWYKQRKSE